MRNTKALETEMAIIKTSEKKPNFDTKLNTALVIGATSALVIIVAAIATLAEDSKSCERAATAVMLTGTLSLVGTIIAAAIGISAQVTKRTTSLTFRTIQDQAQSGSNLIFMSDEDNFKKTL